MTNLMDLSLLIILGSHGYIFLHIRLKHCIHSLNICKKVQNEKCLTLVNFRSDHEGEFENTLIGKMDTKSDKAIFMGYALQSI